MDNVKFYIPDFYYKFALNLRLIALISERPEWFEPGISIGAVYGSFPGAIWNGGRLMSGSTNIENIQSTIGAFNNVGIPVRFTFTNCLLEEKHVHDTYCNLIMQAADNGMNEVLVNSPVLETYLRDRYPNFKYILSTTRCERDVEKINQACEKYDLVVTDFRDNKNVEFLSQIKHWDKVELLLNAYCHPDCQCRAEHYAQLSDDQLNFRNAATFKKCPAPTRKFSEILNFPTVLTRGDVLAMNAVSGFSNFKIEGRAMPHYDIIDSYVYYMAAAEYADQVRDELVRSCMK